VTYSTLKNETNHRISTAGGRVPPSAVISKTVNIPDTGTGRIDQLEKKTALCVCHNLII